MDPAFKAPPARVLLLCLHHHQPVGNFDSVVRQACDRSYLPFLETLARYPSIRVTLHYSGCLLEWFAAHRPEILERLRDLVARGQAEILGGGKYEPVLALLSERDRRGQIRAMADLVGKTFGKRPRGIWLAERVWEPELPVSLAAAGVEYLPLDDFHFLRAGVEGAELDGLWLTETNGAKTLLFPGSERLRYLIPFGSVEEALGEIDRITSREVPFPAAILADDGEKFGVWPGTFDTVYTQGWLERFFGGILARADRLRTMTFSEYADIAPLRGRTYLPSCSYIEMGEWALPAGRAARFGSLLNELRAGRHGGMKPFLSGGTFRGFLRKYEEANQLHKRMLWVSRRVAAAEEKGAGPEGRGFLYRAQCNDAYWHGFFGGLYLNHLRDAAWSNLLRAEEASDRILHAGKTGWTECGSGDIDADGGEEILVKTPQLSLLLHTHDGGAVTEISLTGRGIALGHVLTRREEGYHRKLVDVPAVDPWQRASFREALYREEDPPEAILSDRCSPIAASAGRKATARVTRSTGRVRLVMDLPFAGEGAALSLGKGLLVEAGREGIEARYEMRNDGNGPVSGRFCSEWQFNFLSGEGPDRQYAGLGTAEKNLSTRGVTEAIRWFSISDRWRKVSVTATSDRDFTLLRYPIETDSLSETGVEKIHQGICLRLLFPLRLAPGESECYSIRWTIISVAP
ncbi:MAG: DUF1926 domain-containing protein [Deltaproteobacteria bacterium]